METERSGKEQTWTFLMDAWDALAAMEEGAKGLGTPSRAVAARQIAVVSHRLKGTAALYGFPLISRTAGAVERAFESHEPGREPGEAEAALVRDAAAHIHHALDAVALGTGEDEARFEAFLRKHASFFVPAPLAPLAPLAPPSPPVPAAPHEAGPFDLAPGDGAAPEIPSTPFPEALDEAVPSDSPLGDLRSELDRFFRENSDASFFVPEAEEHLEAAAAALGDGRRSDPAGAVGILFRAFHTLKGAAYTVGCTPIGALSHRVEDLLSSVRTGRQPLDVPVENAIHLSLDTLRSMLPGRPAPGFDVAGAYASVLAAVDAALSGGAAVETPPPASAPATAPLSLPSPLASPVPPAPAGPPAAAAPAAHFGSTIRVHLDRLEGLLALASDLIIVRGRLDRHVRALEAASSEMTVGRRRLAHAIRDFSGKHVNPQLGASPEAAGAPAAPAGNAHGLGGFSDLEFERYDDFNVLARSVGELDEDLGDSQAGLLAVLDSVRTEMQTLGTVVRDLRNSISRVRLVPVGQLFTRFRRLVRQQERETGKSVRLETRGENVEIDNVILERLSDPLLHIVRNALAHGIEAPEERLRLGKDPAGLLRLAAYPRGHKVWIEIADDGAGMDPVALRNRARALGLVPEERLAAMTDEETRELIFIPGFSTMSGLTTEAGRGVGLDVVRTELLRLKGEIEVRSEPGRGATFVLKVPLTLIVSQALLVEVASRTFALPVSSVETLVSIEAADIRVEGDRERITFRGDDLPALRLRRLLGLDGPAPAGEIVGVVVTVGGRRVALLVDRAIGTEDVVLKGLGAFLESLAHFQGAALSASGQLVLVLDPAGLVGLEPPAPSRRQEESGLFALPAGAGTPAPLSGSARVLLVDDSVSVRKVVGRMLSSAGFEVVTAVDGVEALACLRDAPFSLVITDLEMPRLNGFELIQQLRDREAWKALPIVVLTTRVGERHVRVAQELGATGFLSKPVVEERLVNVVRRLCPAAVAGA